MPEILDKTSAHYYQWGEGCEAWALLQSANLRVVQERMPPGRSEMMHHHDRAQQLFFVTRGLLTMVIEGEGAALVHAGRAIRVPPGRRHQARNDSSAPVEFLVIAEPSTYGDRFE